MIQTEEKIQLLSNSKIKRLDNSLAVVSIFMQYVFLLFQTIFFIAVFKPKADKAQDAVFLERGVST